MQLEVRNLTKIYSGGRGLLPLNLSVGRGELVAIVGPNGAGKSTFLKLLAGWIRPDSGEALIDGTPLGERLASVHKIGFVPETPNLFEQFSVDYNLKLFARLFAVPRTRVATILSDFSLLSLRRSLVQSLSKGLKQRVSLGRCLLPDPPILLFDEPTSGLDFAMTSDVHQHLKAVHAAGKTVLFTTHRLAEIGQLATRVLLLQAGQVKFDGAPTAFFNSNADQEPRH